jgi:hypothetical protein
MRNKAAQQLGRLGGKAKTEAKTTAARANGAGGGRPGMYSVTESTGSAPPFCHEVKLSKSAATELAERLASKGRSGIYVEFCRASDGQRGYLNQNRDHSITGEAWTA